MTDRSWFLAAGIAATIASPALAQPPEEEIVVTARGTTDEAEDAALSIIVIDEERLSRSASERFDDILADVAGIQQFRRSDSRSAHPTSQGLSTRGLGGNAAGRVLIVVDGVPQADPFGGWPVLSAIVPDRLRQVRVTHGGGDVDWGPGTLSGTIEVESLRPTGSALTASIAAGSRESLDTRASASHSLGPTALLWSLSHARGNGFVPIVRADRGAADRPAPYRQSTASVRAIVPVGGVVLDANLALFDDRRERGVASSDNGNRGATLSARVAPAMGDAWSLTVYRQLRRFRSQFASVGDGRDTASLVADQYEVPSSGTGLRGEWRALAAPLDLRLIGDVRHVEGETRELYSFSGGDATRRRRAGGNATTIGIGARAEHDAGDWTLTGGARVDHWRIGEGYLHERLLAGGTLTDQEFAGRSGWQPTARAGLAWRAGDGISLRAAAYRGWRLPTLNELYRPFRVGADATAANAELKPEIMHGIEAGADWTVMPALALSLTAFAARLDDAIVNLDRGVGPGVFPGVGFVPAGGAYRMRGNVDRITSRGIEAEGRYRHGRWSGALSLALVDPEISASGEAAALDGKRPAQTARLRGSASLAYRGKGFDWTVSARRASGQFDDDGNVTRLGTSFELDSEVEVGVHPRFAVALRGENLTDARNLTAINNDGSRERTLPRTIWLSIRTR